MAKLHRMTDRRKDSGIVRKPGLLTTDMTAGEALHNIEAKFSNFNQAPFQAFKAMYNQQATVTEVC